MVSGSLEAPGLPRTLSANANQCRAAARTVPKDLEQDAKWDHAKAWTFHSCAAVSDDLTRSLKSLNVA